MADNIEDIEEEGADGGRNTPNRLRIQTQCGGCRFLHKHAAKGNDKPCIYLGFTETSMSCDLYDADYHIPRNRIDILGPIYSRLDELLQPIYDGVPAKLTEHEVGNIAYAIGNSERLKNVSRKKRGEELRVGQKVFVFMELPDTKKEFANLWYEAYVAGISRQGRVGGEFLTVYSSVADLEGGRPNGNKWAVMSMPLDSKSLITEEQMQDKLIRMMEKGTLNYEHQDYPQVTAERTEDGEIDVETVAMADAPDSAFERARKKFEEKLRLKEHFRTVDAVVGRRRRGAG